MTTFSAGAPGSLVLDWAGPAEALRIANQTLAKQGQPERFVQHFVSPTPESVSSVGAVLTWLEPLPPTLPSPAAPPAALKSCCNAGGAC